MADGRALWHRYPEYFFDLPPERVVKKDLLDIDLAFLFAPDAMRPGENGEWSACARFVASKTSDANMLLWVDTPLALFSHLRGDLDARQRPRGCGS